MTRGELVLAQSFGRTLYYGTAPVVVLQLPHYFDKSEVVVVRSAFNSKGRQWRVNFEELSSLPKREVA